MLSPLFNRVDLFQAGVECFKKQMSLFPGLRAAILRSRFTNASAFTYYPADLTDYSADVLERGMIFDPRVRDMSALERGHLEHCYEFIDSLLVSPQSYLFIQADYRRLFRTDENGNLRSAPGEKLIVLENLDLPVSSEYRKEVWVYLQGGRVEKKEIELTMNRGMLYPRPFGILATLQIAVESGVTSKTLQNEIVDSAGYLVYDAFDGQWPIFAGLEAS